MLTDETDAVLLGSTPRSEAAAAAARWRRRERSAKRMELTADRIEQAAALFERLQVRSLSPDLHKPSQTP